MGVVRTPATAATTTTTPDSVYSGPTLHIPMQHTTPLQPYEQQELERDMRKYEIDVRNGGDTKRRLLELASQERIRYAELELQLAVEKERQQASLSNHKETIKARIEEAKASREEARAEQEKQKTLRKDAVEASNVRRWELEADLRLAATTAAAAVTSTPAARNAKTATAATFKRILGPRATVAKVSATEEEPPSLKRRSARMVDVNVPCPRPYSTFTKPRYTQQYDRPRRGSNKEN